jgi:hypothetical protein
MKYFLIFCIIVATSGCSTPNDRRETYFISPVELKEATKVVYSNLDYYTEITKREDIQKVIDLISYNKEYSRAQIRGMAAEYLEFYINDRKILMISIYNSGLTWGVYKERMLIRYCSEKNPKCCDSCKLHLPIRLLINKFTKKYGSSSR